MSIESSGWIRTEPPVGGELSQANVRNQGMRSPKTCSPDYNRRDEQFEDEHTRDIKHYGQTLFKANAK